MDEVKKTRKRKSSEDALPLKGVGLLKNDIRDEIKNIILTVKEHFILLLSGRNVGKTYTVQKTVIDDCMQNHTEFALIVESDKEREKGALKDWLKKVELREYANYQFKHISDAVYYRKNNDEDWTRIGICIPLRKAGSVQKKHNEPLVNYMIMDEAILNDTQYLKYYIDWFLTIYETIDRREDRVKAIMMGNPMQKINPVFKFFGLTVKDLDKQGIEKRENNKYFWYIPKPIDLDENEDGDESMFANMIKGTEYGEMSEGNFTQDYGQFLQYPDEGVHIYQDYGIKFDKDTFMQILDADDGNYYAEVLYNFEHLTEYCNPIYNVLYKEATEEYPIVPKWFVDIIRIAFNTGRFKFIDEESLLMANQYFTNSFGIRIGL